MDHRPPSNAEPWDPSQRRRTAVERVLEGEPIGRFAWQHSFDGPYTLECRRQRYWKAEPTDFFKSREIEWRLSASGSLCAVAKFVEWISSAEGFVSDFIDEADASSAADLDMAYAIKDSWQWWEPPFDYGTVIRFERLAIDTRKDSSRLAWWYIAQAIRREFRRRVAVMLLKAFPLEYECEVTSEERRQAFEVRQKAMMRLYQHRLGVEKLPTSWGDEGWMCLLLRCPDPPANLEKD